MNVADSAVSDPVDPDARDSGAGDRMIVDLLDPELYRRDPHDVWEWMRHHEPVYRDERNGLWGVTRHADLMDVERRSSVFLSGQGYRALWSPEEINMIAQDDPRHRQQRMLVQGSFTKKSVEARRQEVIDIVTSTLDGALDGLGSGAVGEIELVETVAGQIPARLTANLLGYPEERWRDLKSWSERLMRTDMRERDGKIFREFIAANEEFVEALGEVAQAKMADPGDDLISTWLHAQIDGEPLPPEAIAHEVGLFISGGAETTRTAISHGLRAFVDHPDQWDQLRHAIESDDRALVDSAVEEILRWSTPVLHMRRTTSRPTELAGTTIAAGEKVVMFYNSGNRDERVFENPYDFDITRDNSAQIGFGGPGPHFCLGAHLARRQINVLFRELLTQLPDIAVVGEPDYLRSNFINGIKHLNVEFTPVG